jgi:hypothetical protein
MELHQSSRGQDRASLGGKSGRRAGARGHAVYSLGGEAPRKAALRGGEERLHLLLGRRPAPFRLLRPVERIAANNARKTERGISDGAVYRILQAGESSSDSLPAKAEIAAFSRGEGRHGKTTVVGKGREGRLTCRRPKCRSHACCSSTAPPLPWPRRPPCLSFWPFFSPVSASRPRNAPVVWPVCELVECLRGRVEWGGGMITIGLGEES